MARKIPNALFCIASVAAEAPSLRFLVGFRVRSLSNLKTGKLTLRMEAPVGFDAAAALQPWPHEVALKLLVIHTRDILLQNRSEEMPIASQDAVALDGKVICRNAIRIDRALYPTGFMTRQ